MHIAEINLGIQFTVNNESDENTYGTTLHRLSCQRKLRQHFGHNSVQEDKKYKKMPELS